MLIRPSACVHALGGIGRPQSSDARRSDFLTLDRDSGVALPDAHTWLAAASQGDDATG